MSSPESRYAYLGPAGTFTEAALLGCVYIDPPEKQGADAEISWWVVDDRSGTSLERALDTLVPQWIAADWPFTQPRCIGRDLSWADWLALPDLTGLSARSLAGQVDELELDVVGIGEDDHRVRPSTSLARSAA